MNLAMTSLEEAWVLQYLVEVGVPAQTKHAFKTWKYWTITRTNLDRKCRPRSLVVHGNFMCDLKTSRM